MGSEIYFDNNATTRLAPEAYEAMGPYLTEHYGNPSSIHSFGSQVARKIQEAREQVAALLGATDPVEIIFTSCGTEGDNAAIRAILEARPERRHIVATQVEHPAVLGPCQHLEKRGYRMTWLHVDQEGRIDLDELRDSLSDDTALVSVMYANNETGVIFPVEEIGKYLREKKILFHVDAVQTVGKIPFSLKSCAVDYLSLSAHKFGGPKGIGALYVRKGAPYRSLIFGGGQERGRRAGTENLSGIVGLGEAAKYLQRIMVQEIEKVRELRDRFESEVFRNIAQVEVNGDRTNRLSNTSNLSFEGVDSEALLILLDEAGVCASSGSACLSGAPEPSRVLKAMGFSDERARSSIRFSFGHGNTSQEINRAVKLLKNFVVRLRQIELEDQHPHSSV